MKLLAPLAFVCGLAAMALATNLEDAKTPPMKLGSFTVCLAVKDLEASKAFYEKLDFQQVSGDVKKRWVVVQNGTTKIGLFQGLIPKNSLTFNPGSTPERETLKDFQDVRELQHVLKSRGVAVKNEIDETTDGPAGFEITDPDGYPILIDQYVSKPKR